MVRDILIATRCVASRESRESYSRDTRGAKVEKSLQSILILIITFLRSIELICEQFAGQN